ncbi:uncharacterized protein LOC141827291 [Curcuma longa]|uniref:uncharacterized protein LOC141827291 n=1 Tax=Curcuma longa TaxID=136217 RepID=UPI003D9E8CFA
MMEEQRTENCQMFSQLQGDIAKLNEKFDACDKRLRMQEIQIAQLISSLSSRQVGALPEKSDFNPMENYKAIELRSGRILKDRETQGTTPLGDISDTLAVERLPFPMPTVGDKSEGVETAPPSEEPSNETTVRNILFPQRLKCKQKDAEFEKLYNMVKDITLDIPLLDALIEMPQFTKFIKRLMSIKKITEARHTVALTKEVSAIILNSKPPPKLKDPGSFTLPCRISKMTISRAFCDLGASVNIIPYTTSIKYGYTDLKLTTMVIQLADYSCRHPMGIVEDVPVEVGGFTILTDFVVFDIEEDLSMPIILERSFLVTTGVKINVKNYILSLEVGNKKVDFNLSLYSNTYLLDKNAAATYLNALDSLLDIHLLQIREEDGTRAKPLEFPLDPEIDRTYRRRLREQRVISQEQPQNMAQKSLKDYVAPQMRGATSCIAIPNIEVANFEFNPGFIAMIQ